MEKQPTEYIPERPGRHSGSAPAPPLWLLQKEDTSFLCLSFLASVLLHGILFVILAATRIFQPFTGVSGEFELVWFSPSSMESDPIRNGEKTRVVQRTAAPIGEKRTNRTRVPKHQIPVQKDAPPSTALTTPAVKPPSSRVVDVPEKWEKESLSADADAEMVVSRFGGKVVEIVGKDIEIPVYKVFSAAQRSSGRRAMVQYLPEEGSQPFEKPLIVKMKEPSVPEPSDKKAGTGPAALIPPVTVPVAAPAAIAKKSVAAAEPMKEQAENGAKKRLEKYARPPAPERVVIVEKIVPSKGRPVQPRQSSSVVKSVSETPSGVHTTGTSARELPLVESVPLPLPKSPTEEKRPSSQVVIMEKAPAQRTEVPSPAAKEPMERPTPVMPRAEPKVVKPVSVIVRKSEPVSGKPSPAQPEKPRAILMPPLAGDLKIVITGKEEIKIEAVFREFRKARRGRPMTRGEARNTRRVSLKRARTHLNVHEAVIEITEEGVYDLTIRSADGKPVTAFFVLKMHESGKGAVTKNLGKRTLRDGALLARILMPEGILWDDESWFTGTMEDSDSITRFNTETGLVWREFR